MRQKAEESSTRKIMREAIPRKVINVGKGFREFLHALRTIYRDGAHQQNRRHVAVDEFAGYMIGAEVPGHYLEFGVYEGETFIHACKVFGKWFPDMHFYAFDSFEGLPEPKGFDKEEHFYQGQFTCPVSRFQKRLKKYGCPMNRIHTIPGWFDKTVGPEATDDHGIQQIAVAWIDGDLYESAVPVLHFLTHRISDGTIIAFDDWHCYRNLPSRGEQRACREWLDANPHIRLHPFYSFGWHGQAFTVEICTNTFAQTLNETR